MDLNNLLKKRLPKNKTTKKIAIAMLIIALIGFSDATFLTIKHYNGSKLSCGINGGCNTVTTSGYSQIFGIPVALFGSVYYLIILLSSVGFLDSRKKILAYILSWIPIAGLIASAWFVFVQFFILYEICVYCMGSAITSTILFVLGMVFAHYSKKTNNILHLS